jgi:hypothetical protein
MLLEFLELFVEWRKVMCDFIEALELFFNGER